MSVEGSKLMATFTIHVPFEQHDAYEVEADSAEQAIEIARHDPEKRTSINIDDCIEYDWDSAIAQDENGEHYDSFGKKF